jgi:hypothetical protein
MANSRKSEAIVAALMNNLDSSSSEDEPVAVAAVVEPPTGDNEWDILKALRARGQYPSWDLEWL